MECHICEVRSSVSYCVECKGLLCETCGVPCDQCGKASCPEHVHETRGGRALCSVCYAERRAKRDQAKAAAHHKRGHVEDEDTSLVGLERKPGEEPEEVSAEVLTASGAKAVQPWQMSLYIALAGVLLALVILSFPSLQRIPVGRSSTFATGYILLVFPTLGILWGLIGLLREDYIIDRPKALFGLGAAAAAIVLTMMSVWAGRTVVVRPTPAGIEHRDISMPPEKLETWRENVLDKYKR